MKIIITIGLLLLIAGTAGTASANTPGGHVTMHPPIRVVEKPPVAHFEAPRKPSRPTVSVNVHAPLSK